MWTSSPIAAGAVADLWGSCVAPCALDVVANCCRPHSRATSSAHSRNSRAPQCRSHDRIDHGSTPAAPQVGSGERGPSDRRPLPCAGHRDPRVQRGDRAARLRTSAARPPQHAAALLVPDHHRRQRQHRRHPRRRPSAGRRVPRGDRPAPGREGTRTRPGRGLGHLGRRGPRLHGRRSLHRPLRAFRSRRSVDLRAFRAGDRQPAHPRLPRRPRTETRVHLPLLQPDPADRVANPVSATPNVDSRRSAPMSHNRFCRSWRTPVGSSTPNCLYSRSEQVCGSTKYRSTGPTTPKAASTSSTPRSPTSKASHVCGSDRSAAGCPYRSSDPDPRVGINRSEANVVEHRGPSGQRDPT